MLIEKINHKIILETSEKLMVLLICLSLIFAGALALPTGVSYATSAPTATCKVNASGGVNLRKSASTTSKALMVVADNKKLTIKKAVFTSASSTKKTKIWYYVSVSGKTGYVRSDCVDTIKYSSKAGTCIENDVFIRSGAGTGMKSCGSLNYGDNFKILLAATAKDSEYKNWYLIKFNGEKCYVYKDYAKFGTTKAVVPSDNPNRSDVAKALLKNPTNGGDCRVVYTFDESNCTKKWSSGITGWQINSSGTNTAKIPQGFAYNSTDKEYAAVFALEGTAYAICTYDKNGNKLVSKKLGSGHRNGITWNKTTGKYYICESAQSKLITYDPSTGKTGSVSMPTTASGIAYDRKTDETIATVKSPYKQGIIVYSGDDKFTKKKCFSRCSHNISYYAQDCGAHYGFVFHCISNQKAHQTDNYIDVYRVEDGRYLGTIQTMMGEMESCVVNSSGYLELLCNRKGEPDYIWKTPLKVSDLK